MGLPEGVLLADIDAMNVFRTQNVYAQGTRPNEGAEAGRMFRGRANTRPDGRGASYRKLLGCL